MRAVLECPIKLHPARWSEYKELEWLLKKKIYLPIYGYDGSLLLHRLSVAVHLGVFSLR